MQYIRNLGQSLVACHVFSYVLSLAYLSLRQSQSTTLSDFKLQAPWAKNSSRVNYIILTTYVVAFNDNNI